MVFEPSDGVDGQSDGRGEEVDVTIPAGLEFLTTLAGGSADVSFDSRSLIESLLSCSFLPRAKPISIFARPFLK